MGKVELFYETYIPGEIKGTGPQKATDCPFCGHKRDFSFNVETGQCKCFQCSFKGDAFSFLQKLKGVTFQEAKEIPGRYEIEPITDTDSLPVQRKPAPTKTTPPTITTYVKTFRDNLTEDQLRNLKASRGIRPRLSKRYNLGWASKHLYFSNGGERLTIPVKKGNKYVNIRFHSLNDRKPKNLPFKKDLPYATWLFPEDVLSDDDTIWLCEGDLDALYGLSHHLTCLSVTGGAGSWRDEFIEFFRGKVVMIIYDCDQAGRKGAEKIAGILSEVAVEVKVINLGLSGGEDLTDWFVKYRKSEGELRELARRTPVFEVPVAVDRNSERVAQQLAAHSLTSREILELTLPEEQFWIGGGLIPKSGYVLLAGAAKEGKTILGLQISLCLVTGTTLLERFPIQERAEVVYLYAENTRSGLQTILRKQFQAAKDQGWSQSAKDLDHLVLQEAKSLVLSNAKGAKELDALLNIHKPNLCVIDPISLSVSGNINRLENVTRLVANLNQIGARHNCTWIIIHHYRKPTKEDISEAMYKVMGSSGFANYCESFIGLERSHQRRSTNFKTLHFRLRREEEPRPLHLHWNTDTLLYEPVSWQEAMTAGINVNDVVGILRDDLQGEASYSEIADLGKEEFGVTKQRIAELLKYAQERGLVEKKKGKFGRWFVL